METVEESGNNGVREFHVLARNGKLVQCGMFLIKRVGNHVAFVDITHPTTIKYVGTDDYPFVGRVKVERTWTSAKITNVVLTDEESQEWSFASEEPGPEFNRDAALEEARGVLDNFSPTLRVGGFKVLGGAEFTANVLQINVDGVDKHHLRLAENKWLLLTADGFQSDMYSSKEIQHLEEAFELWKKQQEVPRIFNLIGIIEHEGEYLLGSYSTFEEAVEAYKDFTADSDDRHIDKYVVDSRELGSAAYCGDDCVIVIWER